MLMTLRVCVCVHVQRPVVRNGFAAGFVSRQASADRVEDAVLDRMQDLGRIQTDFDLVGWMKVWALCALALITRRHGSSPAPTSLRPRHPSRRPHVEKAGIVHIMSTPWPCQLDKGGVSIPDNTAERQRLFSYVFWKTSTKIKNERETRKKANKKEEDDKTIEGEQQGQESRNPKP